MKRRKKKYGAYPEDASLELMRRAAELLASGWFTTTDLGYALYGRSDRQNWEKNVAMRARRAVNRMRKLGLLVERPKEPRHNGHGKAILERTMADGWEEVLG